MKLLCKTNSKKWADEDAMDAQNEFGVEAVLRFDHRASDGDIIYEIYLNDDALCEAGCAQYPFLWWGN